MDASRRARASPLARPPPPPRTLRSDPMTLGLALVASLDEPSTRPSNTSPFQRPRSDSTLSSDTFDGIYALDDDVGSVDVDDVDMDDLHVEELDHVDAFRPSKMDEEFGRPSDLERMFMGPDNLSTLTHGEPTARSDRMDVEVDEDEATAVMAHLTQLDAQQKTKTSGFCALRPSDGRQVVVSSGANAENGVALPPRGVETKRRVHKRTFGEQAATFRFHLPIHGSGSPVKASASKAKSMTTTHRVRSLFREAAEDIARRRDVEEAYLPPEISLPAGKSDVEMDETTDDSTDVKIKVEPSIFQAHSPVRLNPKAPLAGPKAFQTPQRRANQSITEATEFLTPLVSTSTTTTTALVPASISPAPTFDKVAVVHAKDTPGKVDKFEWTIRTTTHPIDAAIHPSLPPPYLRDTTTSTLKRRVHSSTFGSFARSFSFTTP